MKHESKSRDVKGDEVVDDDAEGDRESDHALHPYGDSTHTSSRPSPERDTTAAGKDTSRSCPRATIAKS